jgi:uncharacterized protein (TIGR02300 family)
MRKASPKASPVSLGTKRACPSCGTKFYDFNKPDILCPKCESKINTEQTSTFKPAPEVKKPAKPASRDAGESVLAEGEEIVVDDEMHFESVDDLEDDEDDLVEDIDPDDDDRENY